MEKKFISLIFLMLVFYSADLSAQTNVPASNKRMVATQTVTTNSPSQNNKSTTENDIESNLKGASSSNTSAVNIPDTVGILSNKKHD